MLHCPQGIPWSLKGPLFIEEYPFNIMLYFLQRILSLFKGHSMHCVFLRTETSTSFQGIVVYMNGFPFVQELKYNHTQPDSFTRTAVCFEGLFLRGTLHTVERNVYTCTCIYIYIYIQLLLLFLLSNLSCWPQLTC